MQRRRFVRACSIVALFTTISVAARAPAPQNPYAAAPRNEHELLKKLAGKWDATFELSAPGAPPIKSTATEVGESLGGLWVVSRYEDPHMPGGGFSGAQIVGYDPAKKAYVATWVDSQSAELAIQEGAYDAATSTLTLTGSSPDPRSGKPSKSTYVLRFADDDHRSSTLIAAGPDGKEVPMFTIQYARAK